MASVFGHAILAGAVGTSLSKELRKPSVFLLGVICSIFPDADILAFKFGIPYEALWGHRGMTHSIIFGLLMGVLVACVFHWKRSRKQKGILTLYYSFCAISHGILDGMTTGGRGVAYFSPFDTERYFLPFRKIQVSPIGARRFFSEWGLEVLRSEAFWIGIPCLIFVVLVIAARQTR